jgi:hypothetical protein
MLASCPQDLFFNDNHKDKRSRHFHQQLRKSSMMSTNSDLMIGLNANDMSDPSNNNNKDKEEQVWPPDVESAFIEGTLIFLCKKKKKILIPPSPSLLKHWNQSLSWVEERFLLMENLVVVMN